MCACAAGYRQFPALYQQQLKGVWDDADQALVQNKIPSVGRMRKVQVGSSMC